MSETRRWQRGLTDSRCTSVSQNDPGFSVVRRGDEFRWTRCRDPFLGLGVVSDTPGYIVSGRAEEIRVQVERFKTDLCSEGIVIGVRPLRVGTGYAG